MDKGSLKKKSKSEYITLFSVLLCRLLYYYNAELAVLGGDSTTYIYWKIDDFFTGMRMPIYPAIIRLNAILFSEKYLIGVVWFQIVVSLLAILLLWKAVYTATDNKMAANVITIFWGG